jgi:hypothetical protein
MRIRTILAAAAAPAALAAVLLGTAGQASAATVPAVLTASVQQQQGAVVTAHTHQNGVTDTTNVPTGTDSPGGPVWAYDNLERTITAVQDAPGSQLWHVTVASTGSFNGFANPIDGKAAPGLSGSVKGTITFDVQATGAPDGKNLPAQSGLSLHSSDLATGLWLPGTASVVPNSPSPYTFYYTPIPVPNDPAYQSGYLGITYGVGPNGLGYQQVG